jgi:hypothetical protein
MFGPQHPEWPSWRNTIEARIVERVAELESPVDIDRTNFIRGQIAALRDLLSVEAPPIPGVKPASYS